MLKNPWIDLPSEAPYILPCDSEHFRGFNSRLSNPDHRLVSSCLPDPFVGDPKVAKVLLLALNPGHSPEDVDWHHTPRFRDLMLANYRHSLEGLPFYPLREESEGSGANHWWRLKTKALIESCGADAVGKGIHLVQWLGYRSKSFKLPGAFKMFPSQAYSFSLVQDFIDKKRGPVILMRSRSLWEKFVTLPEDVITLKNPRNPTFSQRNMKPGDFEKLVEVLRGT